MENQSEKRNDQVGGVVAEAVRPMDVRVMELKERFTKLGIASYRISGLDEYESLVSYLRSNDSFRYAFIRDPYARSKNLIWRLMKVDIWAPKLPMGYWGCPGFCFDYMGEGAMAEAVKIANIFLGQKYVARKLDEDRVSMRQVLDERIPIEPSDIMFLKQRNYSKITWK